MEFSRDQIIGPYKLIKPLGQPGPSSFGAAWLAEDRDAESGEQFVVKLLNIDQFDHAALQRDGQVWTRLNAAHVLPALEVNNYPVFIDHYYDKLPLVAREYVVGGPLQELFAPDQFILPPVDAGGFTLNRKAATLTSVSGSFVN